MKVLHVLVSGGIGGIENLMKEYSQTSYHDNYFLFLWRGGIICDEMRDLGAKVIVWNIKTRDYFLTPFKIFKLIKRERIEAIVTHNASPLIHLSNLVAITLSKNLKSFTYLHGDAEDEFRTGPNESKITKAILKQSYYKSKKTIAISNYVADSLVKKIKLSRDKISVIYNGVNINKFDNINKNHTDSSTGKELKIIYVGRLEEVKGVQNTLKILSVMKDTISFRFNVVGDGSYKDNLMKLSDELGIKNRVNFMGNRRDVPLLLSQADVFMHIPEWQEGFGITVIEAMAAGCICIVNNHGALPEIVDNGINGFVVANDAEIIGILKKIWNEKVNAKGSKMNLQQIRGKAIEKANEFNIEKFSEKLDVTIESGI